MGAQLLSNSARQEKEWVSSVKIIHLTPKYVKLHVIAENIHNRPEMTEQCLRCLLPTGSDQKSEKVKSCTTPMPTSTLIFLIVGCVRNLVLELVSSAYEADAARVPLKNFTVPQK